MLGQIMDRIFYLCLPPFAARRLSAFLAFAISRVKAINTPGTDQVFFKPAKRGAEKSILMLF